MAAIHILGRSALSIHDILCVIFAHCWEPSGRKGALAKYARVCKAFYAAALPLLWEDLPSVKPLMRLLNSSGDVPPGQEKSEIAFTPQELERWRVHATLVTAIETLEFKFPSPQAAGCGTHLDLTVWIELGKVFRGNSEYLLPNLRRTRWCIVTPESIQGFIGVPLSPRLETLMVDAIPSPVSTSSRFCPPNPTPQEKLAWVPAIEEVVSYVGSTAHNLRRLHVDFGGLGLSPSMASSIGRMGTLTSLVIKDTCSRIPTDTLLGAIAESHMRLQVLRLSCAPLDAISPAFLSRSPPVLRDLQTLILDEFTYEDLCQDCAIWAKLCPNLRDFRCTMRTRSAPGAAWVWHDPSTDTPLGLAVRPLLSLTLLEHVEINDMLRVGPTFTLGDADLVPMAEAWPRLQTLSVSPWSERSPPPDECPTAASLAAFAAHCPGLQVLSLRYLNLRNDRLGPLADYPSAGHGLRSLLTDVMGEGVYADDYARCARIVDRMFPCLDVDQLSLAYGGWGMASFGMSGAMASLVQEVEKCQQARGQTSGSGGMSSVIRALATGMDE